MNIEEINQKVIEKSQIIDKILTEVEKVIVGQKYMIRRMLIGLLSDGHILLEGVPGLAKTLAVNTVAETLKATFRRIQFTPDLLPADLVGTLIYNQKTSEFVPKKGPIFANFILADEINRAPAKVQSALLESMQERQVTISDTTYPLPRPFLVMATQNPIEQEGTFPLPEAQLDRFMIKLSLGYPSLEEEREILHRRRTRKQDDFTLNTICDEKTLIQMSQRLEEIHVDKDIEKYIATIVAQTRHDNRTAVGASPRGSLALLKLARAEAALHGRDYVIPDDVKTYIVPALAHRLILKPDLWMNKSASTDILSTIAKTVPVPVID